MNYVQLLWNLFQIKRNEKKTKEEIRELQQKKLQSLLKYAYKNSAYYRKTFEKAGITEENIEDVGIEQIPTIDKKTLIQNFDELVTVENVTQEKMRTFDEQEKEKKNLFQGKYHLVHSSGSTGTPAYFLYDEEAWSTMLLGIIRAALWNMSFVQIIKLLVQKPRIMYLAATDGRYGGAMAVGDGINGLHMKQMHLNVQKPLKEWIEAVNQFKPNIIIGYPSAIKILGEMVQDKKMELNLSRVITCGEPLSSNLEQYFVRTFICPVINVYGASESLALGAAISGTKGLCLFDDLNVIEVMEDKIYLTCLYNFAQPIIRYCLSDELKYLKPQAGQNAFTWVETILGRNEDVLWFEDESGNRELIHPLSIEGICATGLLDYQIKKISNNQFEIYTQAETEKDREQIEHIIRHKMKEVLEDKKLEYVNFQIKFVDSIVPDQQTGKKKLVIL